MEAKQRLVLMTGVEKNAAQIAFDGWALVEHFADFPLREDIPTSADVPRLELRLEI
ncbi:hypothetical protein [Candidatus Nitrotoga sp. M5]|uniref:hypothetical protein n=1 Tax=Candidatus Nitrotoga sp. M5 TaxID=2890409 RepID=UPI001EF1A73E|nr:hypothetical protein [Candidatus Nitrotoga sp. M5]CAH1385780.1 conserved hypothetical protein [Candidatus Nitrotoga sp. M5]